MPICVICGEVLFLFHRLRDSHLQSAKLGKPSQSADAGVAGIGLLAQVVHHLVSVVGAHGDGGAAALLHQEEGFHHVVHVYVSFQVVCFVEVAFGIALRAAQVDEVDAVGKLLHEGGTVVGAAHA